MHVDKAYAILREGCLKLIRRKECREVTKVLKLWKTLAGIT